MKQEDVTVIKPEGAVKDMLDNFTREYGRTDAAGNKICRDSLEIGVKVQPEDAATAQLMEGVLNTDGYLYMQKGDVLVLRTDSVLAKPCREEFEEYMSKKLGVKVVLIDRAIEVVGVVEHGTRVFT